MKFSLIASFLSATAIVTAKPVSLNSTATADLTPTAAADKPNTTGVPQSSQTLYPSLQVRFKSKDPKTLAKNTKTGHLLSNPNEQVHTAVYFNLPEAQAAGKTCRFVFRLSQDDWAIGPGNSPAQFDIYRSDGCLNEGYSWEHRLSPAIHAGTVTPKKGQEAVWTSIDMRAYPTEAYMGSSPDFPCKSDEYSFEMVAAPGSNIGWTSGRGSGLSLVIV
ncbi:hypothetical protein F5X68DRAFT_235128 [Plectosphaerella plurivora]|uniref:Ubiquitin 3 binding protein But2 C-terminal domain-containing protein n=1 Tax=Plectosphaerella plurivora TaxID=936078 RepID=A0A9P8V6R9_9PEZI|nr:hypothetical protein F5X68DRAFT_235128 [Plectosphaerella plurivora]